jgi:hypothetical protein
MKTSTLKLRSVNNGNKNNYKISQTKIQQKTLKYLKAQKNYKSFKSIKGH